MHETHLWKSNIISKDAGPWPTSSVKVQLLHWCFSHILVAHWNISLKWVNDVLIELKKDILRKKWKSWKDDYMKSWLNEIREIINS